MSGVRLFQGALEYYLKNQAYFWNATRQHLVLSLSALGVGILICIPLGAWASHRVRAGQALLGLFGGLRVLPSLAVLFLALPYLGLGFTPALVALTFLACPPLLINTYAGLRKVDPAAVESAYAAGMAWNQVFWRVELPLAAPAILGGMRSAAVEVISSAALAAFIGGGGLGDFITRGFALYDASIMLVGAVPIAALALMAEGMLGLLQKVIQPEIGI